MADGVKSDQKRRETRDDIGLRITARFLVLVFLATLATKVKVRSRPVVVVVMLPVTVVMMPVGVMMIVGLCDDRRFIRRVDRRVGVARKAANDGLNQDREQQR